MSNIKKTIARLPGMNAKALAIMSATLIAIVQGHRHSQIDDLLPWNWARIAA